MILRPPDKSGGLNIFYIFNLFLTDTILRLGGMYKMTPNMNRVLINLKDGICDMYKNVYGYTPISNPINMMCTDLVRSMIGSVGIDNVAAHKIMVQALSSSNFEHPDVFIMPQNKITTGKIVNKGFRVDINKVYACEIIKQSTNGSEVIPNEIINFNTYDFKTDLSHSPGESIEDDLVDDYTVLDNDIAYYFNENVFTVILSKIILSDKSERFLVQLVFDTDVFELKNRDKFIDIMPIDEFIVKANMIDPSKPITCEVRDIETILPPELRELLDGRLKNADVGIMAVGPDGSMIPISFNEFIKERREALEKLKKKNPAKKKCNINKKWSNFIADLANKIPFNDNSMKNINMMSKTLSDITSRYKTKYFIIDDIKQLRSVMYDEHSTNVTKNDVVNIDIMVYDYMLFDENDKHISFNKIPEKINKPIGSKTDRKMTFKSLENVDYGIVVVYRSCAPSKDDMIKKSDVTTELMVFGYKK